VEVSNIKRNKAALLSLGNRIYNSVCHLLPKTAISIVQFAVTNFGRILGFLCPFRLAGAFECGMDTAQVSLVS
jgi:hypothetical protein